MSAPSISPCDDPSANAAPISPDRIRAEFRHAWNGYKQYAWGHDELKPLSKTYSDGTQTPSS
ncbi:MAG: glycoside hydrolase family 47 protein [Halobacteriota archaeon]